MRTGPMTLIAVSVVLALAGCATPEPAHGNLQKGAYRPVRAPAFNPTTDAPHTVGQPGHVRSPENYPHSPHKRPLPPSREPGMWAGDGPSAALAPLAPPVLFGVALPLPPDGATEYDIRIASHCAGSMEIVAAYPDRHGLPGLSKSDDVRCLAAALYELCARGMVLHPDSAKAARHKAVRVAAKAFYAAMCSEEQRHDPRLVELLSALGATWARANLHTSVPLE